uniref:Putative secreted protein n=1 Tax=Anopheles triannulatus TaxID=58253 RepID=A0A2M4B369_9DIPT
MLFAVRLTAFHIASLLHIPATMLSTQRLANSTLSAANLGHSNTTCSGVLLTPSPHSGHAGDPAIVGHRVCVCVCAQEVRGADSFSY